MTQTEPQPTIVFLLYPGLTPLDLIGPLQTLTVANEFLPRPFRIVVAGERLEPVETDTAVKLAPSVTLADARRPFGLVVPGGGRALLRAVGNRTLTAYVAEAAGSAEFVASVCTGSLILAAAGLLDGRRATTHWAYCGILERLGARYVEQRWVEDGKFLTAAGVSAGIDMALRLAGRLGGETVARRAQLIIEYQPEPPFGGLDWTQVDAAAERATRLRLAREILAGDPELSRRLATEPD